MFELTVHGIEILVDLVENKMLAMRNGNFFYESEMASLKSCRAKLLKIAEDVPGITLIPFDETYLN